MHGLNILSSFHRTPSSNENWNFSCMDKIGWHPFIGTLSSNENWNFSCMEWHFFIGHRQVNENWNFSCMDHFS